MSKQTYFVKRSKRNMLKITDPNQQNILKITDLLLETETKGNGQSQLTVLFSLITSGLLKISLQ